MLQKKQKRGFGLLACVCLWVLAIALPVPAWGASIEPFIALHLEMDPTDAEVLFRKEPTDDSTFPVTIVEKDQRMSGRVEVVGKTTRHFLKKSLVIKLDKKGPKWQGQHNKISLRSLSTDLSRMREALGWNLFAALGMAVPKVEHLRLYINNEFIGFYLFIEWITPKVMARSGFGDDGLFFHPNDSFYCGDMTLINQPRLEQCFFKISPQDNDFTPLRNLIEEINKTPVDAFDLFFDQHFHADSILNWLILNTLIGNGDTYNKNYFLYFSQKTSQWIVIPWDFDLSFGRNSDPGLPFPYNVLNDNYQYFYPPELGAANPLKEKVLMNPRLLARFKARLGHVLGVTSEKASRPAANHADYKGGGFAWLRALFTRLWKGGDDLSKVAESPVGGFGWFHPDHFNAQVTAFEQRIRNDLAAEKYPGVKGYPFDQQVEALRIYNQWRHALLKKMILEPTPFNTTHWQPYLYYPAFTPVDPAAPPRRQRVPLFLTATTEVAMGNRPVVIMEEFLARPLGILGIQELNQPARVRLEVETEQAPDFIPPGVNRAACIERAWYFDIKTPGTTLTANIQIDYLQESSLRHEIGAKVTDETGLVLWAFQNKVWQPLRTAVNPLANVLKVEGVRLVAGDLLHLVACQKNGVNGA